VYCSLVHGFDDRPGGWHHGKVCAVKVSPLGGQRGGSVRSKRTMRTRGGSVRTKRTLRSLGGSMRSLGGSMRTLGGSVRIMRLKRPMPQVL
jgi:hypothetical protein